MASAAAGRGGSGKMREGKGHEVGSWVLVPGPQSLAVRILQSQSLSLSLKDLSFITTMQIIPV